jgi:hypothetical protein
MNWLNRLTLIPRSTEIRLPPTGAAERLDDAAAPPSKSPADRPTEVSQSIFISYRSLTFPAAAALVKTAWAALQAAMIPGIGGVWFPLTACLILGVLIALANLSEEKPKPLGWVIGLVIAVLNSLVLFAAVLGVSKAAP